MYPIVTLVDGRIRHGSNAVIMGCMAKVLLIDDDKKHAELLKNYLKQFGIALECAGDADEGMRTLSRTDPDLLLLDIMLPGRDGFDICREVRKSSEIPIIMLTARDDIVDRVSGLEIGADDYLSKPFEPKELLLRLERLLIRNQKEVSNESGKSIEIGDKIFDLQRLELYHENHLIKLTNLEASLLNLFALNPEKIISREMVINGLDLSQGRQDLNKRNVDVQITRLRKKIERDPKNPRHLKTVRGRGYRFLP